jgi:hypothetical protein
MVAVARKGSDSHPACTSIPGISALSGSEKTGNPVGLRSACRGNMIYRKSIYRLILLKMV